MNEEPVTPPNESQPVQTAIETQPEPSEWQQQDDPTPLAPSFDVVTWSAAEFVEHTKTPSWYGMFLGGAAGITIVIYLITKEILASVVILVVGVAAAFFASRPPVTKAYELSADHLKIDNKPYDIDTFKSFSVVEEGTHASIWLKPTRRFTPFLIVHYNQQDEQKIFDAFGSILPHEPRELDRLDRISKTLRF